jgi:nucleolar MIF4G domain-containing protein 1
VQTVGFGSIRTKNFNSLILPLSVFIFICFNMAKISNTQIANRKARRKDDRQSKRRKKLVAEESAVQEKNLNPAKNAKVQKKPGRANHNKTKHEVDDKYAGFDPETAAAMKRDDDEIAELEEKMGLKAGGKEKARLHREYAKLEGFGEGFGGFLDGLDHLMTRGIRESENESEDVDLDFGEDINESSEDEEMVPMKGPSEGFDNDESIVDELTEEQDDERGEEHNQSSDDEIFIVEQMDRGPEDEDSGADDESTAELDHDASHVYHPSEGEDIYGNTIDNRKPAVQPTKYVPPHLRTAPLEEDDQDRKEKLRVLQRLLNNALNRLSEDNLISVAHSVSNLYPAYATSDVNESLWSNVFNACVDRPSLMAGMIPVYVACLAGIHIQTGDSVQLGGFLMEHVLTKLWNDLQLSRTQDSDKEVGIAGDIEVNKEICNLMLVFCYLYNFGIVHSSFTYDVIRHFIEHFSELDVELLLLTLSHCGHALRSDDPSALREIVFMVQKRTVEQQKKGLSSSSRLEFMISAMTDLKNNKKRKQDTVFGDKTGKLRKQIGRIKSNVAAGGGSRAADSCLRITLNDILNVEAKGRWWKVGASWVGNQYTGRDDGSIDDSDQAHKEGSSKTTEEEELLKLASTYRMNTDARRSAFCIVMGSADCDDAFEKLVRMGMLKNRTERDTVRVLMECCGNERSYNPFYSHLAARICDYQKQCIFTFQLAFWDTFKQFGDVKLRKAANLAKLLYHLVAVHHSLRLTVLKVIDMSPTTIEEPAMVFLTVFFSTMFESFEHPSDMQQIFDYGISLQKKGDTKADTYEDCEHLGDQEGLKESLSVFFLQTLKSSPKNTKKSKFRANFKAALRICEKNELDSMVNIAY